ncbi:MAG: RNA-binding S4 domain-containing protein [Verrucomicrobiaceae bacterium]|nr:RNA-binding S4 domain-containing protein [Verrucomicrobiaceae bacterium]
MKTENREPRTETQLQRADKWLHHVRVFKTRSLATQACAKGNVTLDGQVVKAARDLRPGDVVEIVRGDLRLRLKVLGAPPQRLGAPRVAEFCENLTPQEWIHRAAEARREKKLVTPPEHEQITRPNKKQLRVLREFWDAQQG